MPEYHPAFLTGERAKIASKSALARFRERWRFHHPLTREQLDYGGSEGRVVDVSFYHGGDCLYELEGVPGVWHEACLEDPEIERLALPPASFVYRVRAETRNDQPVVVVTNRNGVEHLVARHPCNDLVADQMRRVAEIRAVTKFEERYSFMGDRKKYLPTTAV